MLTDEWELVSSPQQEECELVLSPEQEEKIMMLNCWALAQQTEDEALRELFLDMCKSSPYTAAIAGIAPSEGSEGRTLLTFEQVMVITDPHSVVTNSEGKRVLGHRFALPNCPQRNVYHQMTTPPFCPLITALATINCSEHPDERVVNGPQLGYASPNR